MHLTDILVHALSLSHTLSLPLLARAHALKSTDAANELQARVQDDDGDDDIFTFATVDGELVSPIMREDTTSTVTSTATSTPTTTTTPTSTTPTTATTATTTQTSTTASDNSYISSVHFDFFSWIIN